jgi:hypothetical protein
VTKTGASGLLRVILVAAVLVAGLSAYGAYENRKSERWITFDVRLGDGNTWAGGARIVYVIGGTSRTVQLGALPQSKTSQNTWRINKQIHPPVALALSATPSWPGVPVAVVIRGPGISPRPVTAVGPATAATATFVAGP